MPSNRRSVTIMSATGTAMNKISEAVKGDSYYGYTDGLHTIQTIYNGFVGRFSIQATLSLTPEESDWFTITPSIIAGSEFSSEGYVDFASAVSKSEAYTFRGNYTFVRVKIDRAHLGDGVTYDPSYGQVAQVILSS